MQLAPEYSIDIQARIPAALAALHNFIREHDIDILEAEEELWELDDEMVEAARARDADREASVEDAVEFDEPSELRDAIAQAMWDDYIAILAAEGQEVEAD